MAAILHTFKYNLGLVHVQKGWFTEEENANVTRAKDAYVDIVRKVRNVDMNLYDYLHAHQTAREAFIDAMGDRHEYKFATPHVTRTRITRHDQIDNIATDILQHFDATGEVKPVELV